MASADRLLLQRALDDGKLDHAVHALLLLLGEPLSGKQKQRFATLQRAVAKTGELLKMQQQLPALTPALAPQDQDTPLSYSQLQMFTLQTLTPQSTAYNIVRAVRISSRTAPFSHEVVSATCDVLLTKHEALRTLFVTDLNGEPRQRVMPLSYFKNKTGSLVQELPFDRTKHELDELIAHHTTKPFDLATELPIRFYAITDNSDKDDATASWVFVTVMHHIVTDPASSGVFWDDLQTLYLSFLHESSPRSHEQLLQRRLEQLHVESLAQTRVTYRDYAQWQRSRLASGVSASSLQYWIEQLSNEEIPQLELPYDRPRPLNHTSPTGDERRGRTVTFQSSPQLQQNLTELFAAHGSSMFIGLMSVFHLLLSRLSNCDDIVIGAPTSGRSHETLDGVMSYFVNTLPFRVRASSHDTCSFAAFLEIVKQVVVDGFSHMEIPLQKMLEHVQLTRNNAHHSVFQVMFAWENGSGVVAVAPHDGGVDATTKMELTDVALPHQTAKFDLMLSMRYATTEHGHKVLEGTLEYPVDVFDHATIERFTQYFLELASQVTLSPETKPLREIQMIPPLERQTLLRDWGVPPVVTDPQTRPTGQFLDECVCDQVQRTPGNVALRFEGLEWTYETLWRHSSQIAVALQHNPSPPSPVNPLAGVRVGLFLDRGLENIAATIGVLQANAVFIPLDPEFPADRIQYMLENSQAEVVITQCHLLPKLTSLLPATRSVRVLVCENAFSQPSSSLAAHVESYTEERGDPEDTIAYILYTSGSTGKPKGVMVTHANLLTTLQWTRREYAVTSGDIFLQSTSSTLDGSLTQLFTPLLAGASALVTKKNGLHDLAYLAALLETHRVTFCVFVPSYFAMLIDFMGEFPQYVKHVVLAGELFPTALATKFYEKHARYCEISQKRVSTTCLVNEYGPTEASVTSTFFRYPCDVALAATSTSRPSITSEQQSVPIGRGNDDHFLVILDKHQRLVPVNVPGELYVGGRGVASGYWNRPDLTEKSFFSHEQLPWTAPATSTYGSKLSCERAMRWYKTGDLVKWLPSGELLFLGRTDSQVKLRGMRIELHEVRNVLLQSSQVKDAEVLVVNQRLVGYVIVVGAAASQQKSIQQLREYAAQRLPVHMVPHELLLVDQWPRTPNGKLDLRVLAQYKPSSASVVTVKNKKSTIENQEEERDGQCDAELHGATIVVDILKQAWREVLDVDDDGDGDAALCRRSFFELGGNSLSAIRVISLVKPHGLVLKLESFFRCKTLLEMAAACGSSLSTSSDDIGAAGGNSTTNNSMTKSAVVPLNWKPWHAGDNLPLFLVHCADGTVWKMMELARRLPFAVFGLQATHADLAESVEQLAQKYWHEIQQIQRHGPYRIGGFSFGCRIAHAIATIGQQQGATFLPLTLLDGVPFHYQGRKKKNGFPEQMDSDEDDTVDEGDAEGNVTEYVARALGFKPSQQQPQDGDGKLDHARDPERELFDQLVANYTSHCRLDHLYRPCASGPLSKPIQATLYKTSHWDLDVDAYHQNGMEMQIVPVDGEHLTMLRTPHVESVARAVLATAEA